MTLVAFDTSTPATVVAVEEGGEVLSRHLPAPPDSHPAHSTQLLAAAAGLLEEAGSGWPAVDRIGVGTGPGTFTGLRISAATAEGLRRAQGAAVVGVSSLEALSLPARERRPSRPVCAVIDARRGELFAAGWTAVGAVAFGPRVVGPEEAGGLFGPDAAEWAVVGEVPEEFEGALRSAGVDRPAPGDALNLIGGAALCRLALEGEPARGPLLPDYLREPDARRR